MVVQAAMNGTDSSSSVRLVSEIVYRLPKVALLLLVVELGVEVVAIVVVAATCCLFSIAIIRSEAKCETKESLQERDKVADRWMRALVSRIHKSGESKPGCFSPLPPVSRVVVALALLN